MSRLEFKFTRIMKLWLEVWGYSLFFLTLASLAFPSLKFSLKECAKNLLPIFANRYWFFTQYTLLFFSMPILNKAIAEIDKRVLYIILSAGCLFFSIHPFIFGNDIFHLSRGYSALWFMYLYLLAGTMSVRGLFARVTVWRSTILSVIFCILNISAFYFMMHIDSLLGRGFDPHLFRSYNSPFLLCYSVSVFCLFVRLSVFSDALVHVVSIVAPSVFAVYVIHSNPLFRVMTNWNAFWSAFLSNHGTLICVLGVIFSSVIIFGACIAIDFFRNKVLAYVYCGRR